MSCCQHPVFPRRAHANSPGPALPRRIAAWLFVQSGKDGADVYFWRPRFECRACGLKVFLSDTMGGASDGGYLEVGVEHSDGYVERYQTTRFQDAMAGVNPATGTIALEVR